MALRRDRLSYPRARGRARVHARARGTEEDRLKADVVKLAHLLGWRVYTIRRSDQAKVQGRTGKGYPDLTMVRDGRVWIVELKSARGKATPEQEAWLDAWEAVPGVEVGLWRPAHWLDGTIERALR